MTGFTVEIINELHDALFQFVLRADADVTEHRAGGFGKEPLDEIEPGAVLGGEHELKASFGSRRQPSLGLPRDVRGVIVEDDLDRGRGGVGGLQHSEEFDKFAGIDLLTGQVHALVEDRHRSRARQAAWYPLGSIDWQ